MYLRQWHGVSLLAARIYRPPDFTLFTDASGNWGCGDTTDQEWFQCPQWAAVNIATKEVVHIVIAIAIWGAQCGRHVAVGIMRAKTSRDGQIMHLLYCLHFFCARHNVRILTTHIPGVENTAANGKSYPLSCFSPQCPDYINASPPGAVGAGGGDPTRLA
jgi:hypothetical protein